MVGYLYKKCLSVLKEKPVLLWGLSLLATLLIALASMLCLLPVISIPISFVLQAGMAIVFLDGYNRKTVNSDQLFAGFKNFWHVAGGMAWMMLWVLIWSLIPVVGPVFGIIKTYSYRFTPYILMKEPEISATQALRVSMARTEGHKGRMFLCHLGVFGMILGAVLVLGLLSQIPYVGIVFVIIGVLFVLALLAFGPLFLGLLDASFYQELPNEGDIMQNIYAERAAAAAAAAKVAEEAAKARAAEEAAKASAVQAAAMAAETVVEVKGEVTEPAVAAKSKAKKAVKFCTNCGASADADAKFCTKCGTKLD